MQSEGGAKVQQLEPPPPPNNSPPKKQLALGDFSLKKIGWAFFPLL